MSELSDMIGMVCVGREKLLTFEETHKVVEYMRYLNKFMEMWEGFKTYLNNYEGDAIHRRNYKDKMAQFEQKHFPQTQETKDLINDTIKKVRELLVMLGG